jgi:DNA-binding CsgD family transcriptional regulator
MARVGAGDVVVVVPSSVDVEIVRAALQGLVERPVHVVAPDDDDSAQLTACVEAACRAYGIAPRLREVLTGVARGESDREIADRLEMSLRTAKCHLGRLLCRTGTASRAKLMSLLAFGTKPDRVPRSAEASVAESSAPNRGGRGRDARARPASERSAAAGGNTRVRATSRARRSPAGR